jgi:hypothetical protein
VLPPRRPAPARAPLVRAAGTPATGRGRCRWRAAAGRRQRHAARRRSGPAGCPRAGAVQTGVS